MTTARKYINEVLMPDFAKRVKGRILFVGVYAKIDYSVYFKGCEFLTLDNNKDTKPDILMDIQQCKIPAETFDAIIMIGVYESLLFSDAAFREINRMLKKGGLALISVPGKSYFDDKRAIEPWEAWEVMKPLKIIEMRLVYKEKPYYINVIAEKTI